MAEAPAEAPAGAPVPKAANTIADRREKPSLKPIITHLRRELEPLYPVPMGPPHPAFPRTMLQYHLLTEAQLDSIASYYHQRPFTPSCILPPFEASIVANATGKKPLNPRSNPEAYTSVEAYARHQQLHLNLHLLPSFPTLYISAYPAEMNWDEEFLQHVGEVKGSIDRTRIKRRKFGKFIGLRGCKTPTAEKEERAAWRRRREHVTVKGREWASWARRGS